MAQVFSLASEAGWKPFWALAIVVPLLALTAYFVLAPRLVRFEVSPGQLRISGDPIYGRTIPLADLRPEMAKVVDLSSSSEYGLSWRTNGVGLPHYKGGWFRLAGGGKALVFVGDPHNAVIIPHQEGHVVIISPATPDAFIGALQSAPR
jgi:hypothetical protein